MGSPFAPTACFILMVVISIAFLASPLGTYVPWTIIKVDRISGVSSYRSYSLHGVYVCESYSESCGDIVAWEDVSAISPEGGAADSCETASTDILALLGLVIALAGITIISMLLSLFCVTGCLVLLFRLIMVLFIIAGIALPIAAISIWSNGCHDELTENFNTAVLLGVDNITVYRAAGWILALVSIFVTLLSTSCAVYVFKGMGIGLDA